MDQIINVKLDIIVEKDIVLAHFSFSNISSQDVYLLKNLLFLDGSPNRKLFQIETVDGRKIPYVGRRAKRGPWKPEDFVKLTASETVEVSTELQTDYRFPNENVVCKTTYDVVNSSYGTQELFEMESNTAEFNFVPFSN